MDNSLFSYTYNDVVRFNINIKEIKELLKEVHKYRSQYKPYDSYTEKAEDPIENYLNNLKTEQFNLKIKTTELYDNYSCLAVYIFKLDQVVELREWLNKSAEERDPIDDDDNDNDNFLGGEVRYAIIILENWIRRTDEYLSNRNPNDKLGPDITKIPISKWIKMLTPGQIKTIIAALIALVSSSVAIGTALSEFLSNY